MRVVDLLRRSAHFLDVLEDVADVRVNAGAREYFLPSLGRAEGVAPNPEGVASNPAGVASEGQEASSAPHSALPESSSRFACREPENHAGDVAKPRLSDGCAATAATSSILYQEKKETVNAGHARPADEFERRIGMWFKDSVENIVCDGLRLKYERTLYRVSIRPGPGRDRDLASSADQLDRWCRHEIGGEGVWLVRDVSPAGAPHFYGFILADDRRGIPTRIADKISELVGAARPTKVAHVVQRLTGWALVCQKEWINIDVPSRGGVMTPFRTHIARTIGYALKPWPSADRATGHGTRNFRSTEDVIVSGEFELSWEYALETAERQMLEVAQGLLRVPPPLYVSASERAALVAQASAERCARVAG